MKKLLSQLTAIVMASCLLLPGCSGSKSPDQAKEEKKTSSEHTADAIREYSGKHIERARGAQQLGEERTNAIEDVLKQK